MRSALKYLILLFLVITFFSCIHPRKREREAQEVPFEFTERSPLFDDEYFSLQIDSFNNYLTIRLKPTKKISTFTFPKDQDGHSLTATAFSFSLCANGHCINSARLPGARTHSHNKNYFGYNRWMQEQLHFTTDTTDLAYPQPIQFSIPLYAFNKLKRGKNTLELRCLQDLFCSSSKFTRLRINSEKGDTTYEITRNYKRVSPMAFTARFDVNVPQIFKTTIYGYGIELRNDSVYSPVGMDNTLWNSSLPDIYWTISFPGDEFYCSSDYQESTAYYDLKDTFYLYHYTPYDSIAIGVWDHDNLSRDDYIAYKRFSLNKFPQNQTVKVPFGNIKAFELKVVKDLAVNK